MKKSTIVVLSIVGVLVLLIVSVLGWGIGTCNSLVSKQENVQKYASDIQALSLIHISRLEKRLRVNAFAPEYQDAVEPEEYRVVKTKRFAIKPMSVDEAILQMNLLEHEFFMFRQAETNDICVVYKRKNGDYGLIEPEIEE